MSELPGEVSGQEGIFKTEIFITYGFFFLAILFLLFPGCNVDIMPEILSDI